jgi:hypothetical protein
MPPLAAFMVIGFAALAPFYVREMAQCRTSRLKPP